MIYVVQQGDSPARIAQKLTGMAQRALQLVAANPQVPRAVVNGVVTFRSLTIGQQLALPTSWSQFSGNLSGLVGVGDANSIDVELATINAQANNPPAPDPDGSFHGSVSAYQTAGQVAVTSGGLGPDLDATYGVNATGPGTQAAYQQNALLAAINNGDATAASPANAGDASRAQQALINMATYYAQALAAGKAAAAQPPPGGGGGGGGGGGTTTPTPGTGNTAADQLYQYIMENGCDCSAQLQTLTKAFQKTVKLTADGYYGTNTQGALQTVLTSEWNASGNAGPSEQAPAACYTPGGACTPGGKPKPPSASKCPAGQVNDSVTGACVARCANGTTPANGVCAGGGGTTPTPGGCPSGQIADTVTGACVGACPNGAAPASGVCPPAVVQAGNSGASALLAGALIIGTGAAAVSYAVKRNKKHPRRRRHG